MATSIGKTQKGHATPEQAAEKWGTVSAYFALKSWPIRILGAVLLLFAAPLIVTLVIVVRATSPGRGLYRQARIGRYGREFMMYKIRTMYENAEALSGPVWCRPGDSRITPVGKVLRLLHLDELPQLINVVRGEMDLVGPRPERPMFVARLAREIPGYRNRLHVLPGVTGLAQVNLPPDETSECVRRKLVLDCAYIHEATVGLDLRILLCTFLRMLGIRHGRAVRWLRLERSVPESVELDHGSNNLTHYPVPFNGHHAPAELYSTDHIHGTSVVALIADSSTALQEPTAAGTLPLRTPK